MFLSSSEQSGGVSLTGEGKEWKSAVRNTPHTARAIRGCRVDLPVWVVSLRLAIQLVARFMPVTINLHNLSQIKRQFMKPRTS